MPHPPAVGRAAGGLPVEHVILPARGRRRLVGAGWTLEQIQEDFPFIEAADIQQAIAYAAFSLREYHLPITRPA
jgi:hypothetical protein